MHKYSFRAIVTIVLLVAIGLVTSMGIYIFSTYLSKHIYEEAENHIEPAFMLLEDQLYQMIENHQGKDFNSLFERIENTEGILNSYLINSAGELVYQLNQDSLIGVDFKDNIANMDKDISLHFNYKSSPPYSRSLKKIRNSTACIECHSAEKEYLGYFSIDYAMDNTHKDISFARIASILTTLAIMIIIIILIVSLHYQFVRKSLREFDQAIIEINGGLLSTRLKIAETKELGRLGKDFNEMLDTLQRTQNELKDFHKRELRNKYKLATIGEMAARLAHEIRNPLTGIANASEIMAEDIEKEENREILEEIQRQAKRANNAIVGLLKYSGKKTARLSMNNINNVVEAVAAFLTDQQTDKDLSIYIDLQSDIPDLRFDPEQIEDVLLNLGINSSNAIEEQGEIKFKTVYRASDGELLIYVSDNGKGISEENLAKIFQPFFTTRSAGTGLGLAIVKDTIELHNGTIAVENNKEGGGCTFKITLPMQNE